MNVNELFKISPDFFGHHTLEEEVINSLNLITKFWELNDP